MRTLIVGTFLILVVLTVIGGIFDFTRPVDSPSQTTIGGLFTPCLLWGVAFGFLTYRTLTGRLFAGRRWARIDHQLAEAGFRQATKWEIEQTAGIHVLLLGLLGTDRGGGIDHVGIGSVSEREVRAFRARVRGRGIFRWFDVPMVALRVPAHFPNTIVRPAGRGIRPRIEMKRVTFEWERFNRSVEVHSVDRWFATAMLDPRMMEWLEQNSGTW